MMALKEYLDIRQNVKISRKKNNLYLLVCNLIAIIVNNIVPFVSGYYFFKTENLIFVLPVFIVIFFNVVVKD